MTIKLSHSGRSRYLQCSESYRLHYIERWRPVTMSSALLLGSACDLAFNHLLLNKDSATALDEAKKIFIANWEQGEDPYKNKIDLPLNPNIKYFKSDWDNDLLEKSDWAELFKYEKKFFDLKSEIDTVLSEKKNWLDIPEEKRMIYNYAHWLVLQRKGLLLLEAFAKDILPKIKRVVAVQMDLNLPDEDGNIFTGVVDYIAELDDGKIYILDNKTTSTEYEEDAVKVSEQLATYYAILNIQADDPSHPWNVKIDGAGYSVLSKKIIKDITKTCKSCCHVSQGRAHTCDNTVEGKRCGGAWDTVKKFSVKTQFLTGTISEKFAESALENATTVKSCIEMGLFPKNFDKCYDNYGSVCPFLELCHGGNSRGLVKLEKK